MAESRTPLDDVMIQTRLRELPDWHGDRSGLTRTVEMPSFPLAIAVVDAVAQVAEEMDHHPDIDIRWRTLTFHNVTYTENAVTALDVELARRIDEVIAGHSA
ncbi:MAG: 4a-hydroxytetrahydrobiopterin dehydratase [Hamadaea sp.]|uniref:4a-hydroxytetrahydrobiopterin dehydratase n=1 Tax=Hamadaea sp. TaxID=2024425 RepID=UPI0017FEA772|nr:4a-hydroxytetrahydrobiopterin dehydratase [Hamadaea sp.]NUR74181.1 4a-hydroxytetrahydrobiopterin dehydratase [Hamadaea sp.]NUS45925.1 4a-hydroxytetrahydrobiopterin dehydratase [Mycobacteriaceae bacterium]NUT20495.1 4a-hydroxytetrahydrobiopterin dehydratase [Hamadaea sp.]